jgi:hypothetical protein
MHPWQRSQQRQKQRALDAGDASGDSVQWVEYEASAIGRLTVRTCCRWHARPRLGRRGLGWCDNRGPGIVMVVQRWLQLPKGNVLTCSRRLWCHTYHKEGPCAPT